MQLMELPVNDSFNIAKPDVEKTLLEIESSQLLTNNEVYDSAVNILPDIKAAQWYIQGSEYALKSASGSYFPSLSLSGSLRSGYSSAQNLYHTNSLSVTRQIGYLASDPLQMVLSDVTDLLISKSNNIKAQADLQQAKYQYIFYSKLIDHYLGKPIQF